MSTKMLGVLGYEHNEPSRVMALLDQLKLLNGGKLHALSGASPVLT